jgi:hypothetical protein
MERSLRTASDSSILHGTHPRIFGVACASSILIFYPRGFAVGWDYAISWLTILPFEITAAGITIQFWRSDLNIGIWVTVFLIALSAIQIFGVRGFGEGVEDSNPSTGETA